MYVCLVLRQKGHANTNGEYIPEEEKQGKEQNIIVNLFGTHAIDT